MILGEWRAYPLRAIMAALAIAIGVALGFAVHLINASALREFAQAVRTVSGDADLQLHGVTPAGFNETLYPRLAGLDGIADLSPVVELAATIGPDVRLTLLGLDPLRAVHVTPSLIGRTPAATTGDDIFATDRLYLSQAALDLIGRRIGERVEILAAGHAVPFVIAGSLPGVSETQVIGVIDIAAAQWRFGRLGRLNRIDLRLEDGADPARVRRALAAMLPADVEIASQETEVRRSDSLSRAYRVNLNMLALMALLTGGFLVYSAQSLSVARRRPQFALLRVLGARRSALTTQLLIEGGIVGAIGAVAGLALGLGLAAGALRLLGGDLGGGYFSDTTPALIFAPGAALLFLLLGLAAALAGSLLPARVAAQAQPAVALKNVGEAIDPRVRPSARAGLLLLGAGAAAALLPAVGELPLFGYASMALMLAGGVAAMPWLARTLLAPLQRRGFASPALDLAVKRLWGAPSQAAVALCGIVASTSLMIAMAVMIASFRSSVDDWLQQVLPADIYLRIEGAEGSGGFDPALQQQLAADPNIAAIHFSKVVPLRLSPERPPVMLIARGPGLPLIDEAGPVPAGMTPVWVSEPAAWLYGYRAGDELRLPFAPRTRFFVAGIWRDYARQHGAIAIADADYMRLTGDRLRTEASVTLKPGAQAAAAIASLRAKLPDWLAPRVSFAEPGALRAQALAIFDRSFAVTYLLEAIAILVGLAGVAATFSAQTIARAKEFGMLRHLGVSRRQIFAMLAAEGALLGAVGVVAGIGLGIANAQVLIHVINPQSFHWTMETRLPFALFAGVALALVLAAAGTAVLAGRRATSADAVRAVREDW